MAPILSHKEERELMALVFSLAGETVLNKLNSFPLWGEGVNGPSLLQHREMTLNAPNPQPR